MPQEGCPAKNAHTAVHSVYVCALRDIWLSMLEYAEGLNPNLPDCVCA